MISVKANAQQKSSMEYTNNNLTKSVDAKGYSYTYTYDSRHNMTQATSQSGTKYCYTYDNNGNPTALTVKGSILKQVRRIHPMERSCQLLPTRTGEPNRMFMIIPRVRSLLTRTKRVM